MQEIIERRDSALSKLRTTIITVSIAAIGGSIVLLKDIIGNDSSTLIYVKAAWILWAISIATTILSYFAEHQAHAFSAKGEANNVRYKITDFWYSAFGKLYLVGLIAFIFGLFSMLIAVILSV